MSTLFTFGCSFTEDFTHFVDMDGLKYITRTEYIHKFCEGNPPDTWTDVLGKLLKYNTINLGALNASESDLIPTFSGNSNESIFNNFCHVVNHINHNDIVIIQWSFIERFQWAYESHKRMITILPNQYPNNKSDIFDEILINKSHDLWIDELFIKEKLINECANAKGFKVFYWSIDDKIYNRKYDVIKNKNNYLFLNKLTGKNSILDLIYENGGKSITFETNNEIVDSHFGKSAHKVLGELIYNEIRNKI
jgi:hypothetical protein